MQKKVYEKPIVKKQKKMCFAEQTIEAASGKLVCKQCSSCHGCR
ncbi:MAG: hypothetical protein ACLQSX_03670 [Smithella sp.]